MKSPPSFAKTFFIRGKEEILPSFRNIIDQAVRKLPKNFLPPILVSDLTTAFAEGAANALVHAGEIKKRGKIKCRLRFKSNAIVIEIFDHGAGFDLNRVKIPRFDKLETSGRGLFMIRQLVDEVNYKKSRRENVLVMKRELVGLDSESRALDLLFEISNAVLTTSDVQAIYNIILDKALEVFHVERASILVFDQNIQRLKVVASRGMTQALRDAIQVKPGEGIAGYVFRHTKPCLIQDMRKNKSGWDEKKHYKSHSFISAPMILSPMRLGQKPIGVINMTDRLDGRPFTRRDLKLLTTIANQASSFLHTIQLLSQAKEAEMIKRELSIAREIQRSYLPKQAPQREGMELAGWCQTAQSVGGDYFDFIEKDDENFYTVIADVSGHNVAAALTMANFRSHLRTLLLREEDPGKILTSLNRILFDDLSRSDQFISMVLIRLTTRGENGTLANAGHRYPLVIRKREVTAIQGGGTVLGAYPEEKFESISFQLGVEDLLFCYTDGLTEMMNEKGNRFGMERLEGWLKKKSDGGTQKMLDGLKKELNYFTKGAPLSDDATVVAIRKK